MTDLFGAEFFGVNLTTGSFSIYLIPVFLLAAIGGIAGLIYFVLRRRALTTLYLKDPLFDGPSRSFFGLLDVAVRDHFSLFRNVSVNDVICHSGIASPLPGKIRSNSFDLLLCDRRKMLPRCGIVLVERNNPREKETQLLRSFCDRVGLPLLVYETGGMFDVSRLRNDVYQATGLNEVLGTCGVLSDARGPENEEHDVDESDHQASESGEQTEHEHRCKKCGASMVERTIAKGQHAGSKALVCETYPSCRYAILSKEVTS